MIHRIGSDQAPHGDKVCSEDFLYLDTMGLHGADPVVNPTLWQTSKKALSHVEGDH